MDEEPRLSPRKDACTAESGKSLSRCLRLNNNSLQNIERLGEIINAKFENPKNIAWIDLSFNELTTVDPVRNVHFSGKISRCVNTALTESSFQIHILNLISFAGIIRIY